MASKSVRKPRSPSRKTVEAFAQCRATGHHWDDVTGTVPHTKVTYFSGGQRHPKFVFRCETCRMLRFDRWNLATGEIERFYKAPPGYTVSKDLYDDVSRGLYWRREFVKVVKGGG